MILNCLSKWFKNNEDKIMILVFVFFLFGELTRNIIFLFEPNEMKGGAIFFLISAGALFQVLFYKHRYWRIATLFLWISIFMKIIIIKSFRSADTLITTENYETAIVITITGIFCQLLSLIYFYKFLKIKNYLQYYWSYEETDTVSKGKKEC